MDKSVLQNTINKIKHHMEQMQFSLDSKDAFNFHLGRVKSLTNEIKFTANPPLNK